MTAPLMTVTDRMATVVQARRAEVNEDGVLVSEYAMVTMVGVGFAAVLWKVLQSGQAQAVLEHLILGALKSM